MSLDGTLGDHLKPSTKPSRTQALFIVLHARNFTFYLSKMLASLTASLYVVATMNIFVAAIPQLGYNPPASSAVTTGSCTVATFTTTSTVTKPAIYTTTQTVTSTIIQPFTTTSTVTIPFITTVTQPLTTTATIVSTVTVPITSTVTRPVTTIYTQQTTVTAVSTTIVTVPIATTVIKPVTITNTATLIDPITTTLTLTAAPSPAPPRQCNNGPILCCDQVQDASSPSIIGLIGNILGLVGKVLGDVEGLVGVTCVPLGALGGNIGSKQPVCCDNNNYGGVVALGCTRYPYAL